MRVTVTSVLIAVAIMPVFFGCEDYSELDAPSLNPGDIDPAVYVAMGNSLTAGYQNNALYQSSQKYSYPALIARQLRIDEFEQPYLQDPGIPGRLRVSSIEPFELTEDPPHIFPLNLNLSRPYNNLGIPGAPLFDAIDDSDFLTRTVMHQLILRDQQYGTSMLQQALSLEPTLLTFWLGANDILAYALTGGTFTPPTVADTDQFAFIYQQVEQILAAYAAQTDAAVILANIPDVTVIPFVNTVPPVIIDGNTGLPVTDPDGNPIYLIGVGMGDKVLLTALEYLQQGVGIPPEFGGTGDPLPGHVILTVDEQLFAGEVVQEFNDIIAQAAATYGFGLVDIYARLNDIHENGYTLGSMQLTTEFFTGGIFSLDGVHPTTWGYGIIANEFIHTMNQQFDADIPLIHIGALPISIELTLPAQLFTKPDYYNKLFNMEPVNFKLLIDLYTNN